MCACVRLLEKIEDAIDVLLLGTFHFWQSSFNFSYYLGLTFHMVLSKYSLHFALCSQQSAVKISGIFGVPRLASNLKCLSGRERKNSLFWTNKKRVYEFNSPVTLICKKMMFFSRGRGFKPKCRPNQMYGALTGSVDVLCLTLNSIKTERKTKRIKWMIQI